NDLAFVQLIENRVPAHSWIFQLPYVPFPERPPVERMHDYDLCRGYLHSKTLHWSHGSMKGGGPDAWQRDLAAMPLTEQIRIVTMAGFAGIYLDRNGFADHGAATEATLASILCVQPVASRNQRLAYYDLSPYRSQLKEGYADQEWQTLTEEARHPVFVT